MKLLSILLTTFITYSALATCNEAYQVINLKTRKKASSLSTTSAGMPPTAAGFFATSYQLAATGVTSGAGGVVSATTMVRNDLRKPTCFLNRCIQTLPGNSIPLGQGYFRSITYWFWKRPCRIF